MRYIRENTIYKLNKNNLSRTPNSAGNYVLYNKDRQPIYVGTTAGNWGGPYQKHKPKLGRYRYGLRHRIGSYIQEDCYVEHPTKKALRNKGKPTYYMYDSIRSDNQRKAQEKKMKQNMKYNHW